MTIIKSNSWGVLAFFFLALFLLPQIGSAHERQAFEIGDTTYLMVIGSIGEPIIVDDKSGLDLRVYKANPSDVGNTTAAGVEPVAGLEESLELIVSADGESKTMPISAVYNQPGSYKSLFFPTRVTTLTYTLVGEINGVEVKLPFTCMAGDHVMHGSEADKEQVAVTEGVMRVFQSGSFTCPAEKDSLGFPDTSVSLYELKNGSKPDGGTSMDHNMHEGHGGLKMWWQMQNQEMLIALAALLIALYSLVVNLTKKNY